MAKCCDHPQFAGPAPVKGKQMTSAICGNCGTDHGEMSLKKAEDLFKKMGDS